jgi:hypothetical protein
MVDYPAGWTCERTVLRFRVLPAQHASASGSCSATCWPASSRRPSSWWPGRTSGSTPGSGSRMRAPAKCSVIYCCG